MSRYLRPDSLPEALAVLAGGRWAVLAGGTDFYPARVGRAVTEDVLDISRVAELRGVRDDGDAWRIGALATWSDLIAAPLPACFDGLKLAAREIGGEQIQNAGTVAGNICNASPAADGMPALLALDAEVELAGTGGARRLPLSSFVLGSRQTLCRADELVTAIRVPKWPAASRGVFLKLGSRRYLVISIVMVSAVVAVDGQGAVVRCAIAVGSCSAVARRLPALERKLAGRKLDALPADLIAPADLAPLKPIADVRGTPAYRLDAAQTLIRRALARLAA